MSTFSNTASALMDGWKIEVREPWHGSPQWPDDPTQENQIGFVVMSPSGDAAYPRIYKMTPDGLSDKEIALTRQAARFSLARDMEEIVGNVLKNEKERSTP